MFTSAEDMKKKMHKTLDGYVIERGAYERHFGDPTLAVKVTRKRYANGFDGIQVEVYFHEPQPFVDVPVLLVESTSRMIFRSGYIKLSRNQRLTYCVRFRVSGEFAYELVVELPTAQDRVICLRAITA